MLSGGVENIVVGNPKEAEIFITAHYDTCAVMPFPNLMAPTNPVIFVFYQCLVLFMIIILATVVTTPFLLVSENASLSYNVFLLTLVLLLIQLMFGFRNKHNANDNTSGILVLTRILEKLPNEQRKY